MNLPFLLKQHANIFVLLQRLWQHMMFQFHDEHRFLGSQRVPFFEIFIQSSHYSFSVLLVAW